MRLALLLTVLTLPACLSMEAAGDRFDAWVANHDDCEVPEDCAVIYPGCPLGCAVAVDADFEEEAYEEADALIRRYEAAGRSCAYDCVEAPEPECLEGACELVWE